MSNTAYIKIRKLKELRKRNILEKKKNEFSLIIEKIKKDDTYKKLYDITYTRYIDEGLDPDDIQFEDIISLNFNYFAREYGIQIYMLRSNVTVGGTYEK